MSAWDYWPYRPAPTPEPEPLVLVWRMDPVTKRRHTTVVKRSEAEAEGLERVRFD